MKATWNLDPLIEKIAKTVEEHKLPQPGAYTRWLYTGEIGPNEYGCADAANILYIIGRPVRDPEERAACIRVLQDFQQEDTGLFAEPTHHPIHCTAHCSAALELFDAKPKYPLTGLEKFCTKEGLYDLLDNLLWVDSPWNNAHQGAGIFAAFILNGYATPEWQEWYFDWLDAQADPEFAISRAGAVQAGKQEPQYHLYGWFHYLFNYTFARRPYPHAKALVDTVIDLYRDNKLRYDFGKNVGFCEIDWIYTVHRAACQIGYRVEEARALMRDMAGKFIPYLEAVDPKTDKGWDDLHMLFGATCAIAELQLALPGEIFTSYPLRPVLDRRPFI